MPTNRPNLIPLILITIIFPTLHTRQLDRPHTISIQQRRFQSQDGQIKLEVPVNRNQPLILQERRVILIVTDMRTGVDMNIARVNIKAQARRACQHFKKQDA